MFKILYEDSDIIVVEKPAGIESQSSRSFDPDMVSEIKRHIHKFCTDGRDPYVGVIHRLDKPVGGVMVYAKTPKAAALLSRQVQNREIKKWYIAVICGKPVDNVGNFVDYLLRNGKSNYSQVVDKSVAGAKRAELNYRILETIVEEGKELSLAEIELLTGRHHQIRVQFAAHGFPLWGDAKYNNGYAASMTGGSQIALYSHKISFRHPMSGETMEFRGGEQAGVFTKFRLGSIDYSAAVKPGE